jgi:hypothetical protein
MPTVPTESPSLRGALLDVEDEFGHGGGGVAAAVHRRGAGVAGHADHFAHVAHAAVDGGDDAQRQVEFVEHRALLDVHFDEAEVARRIALDLRNVFGLQAGVLHGLAHGDAVGVLLVEPGRSKWPMSAPEPRKVAL